jgi:two-component system chemotaxis response regulator CheB
VEIHSRADRPRLVVIGGSAGAVEVLQRIVAGLAPDLPAAFCVVVHLPPFIESGLPAVLSRAGRLPCVSASDGAPLRAGQIVVAPANHHLVVDGEQVRLDLGPRENGVRPAVDVLFRSAAASRGSDVIGVVLSGARDDGAAGLAAIKAQGGGAVVQDPADALFPSMPMSALAQVAVDATAPADELPHVIDRLLHAPTAALQSRPDPMSQPDDQLITVCPDCGGVMTETDADVLQWRCHVGHVYSAATLDELQGVEVEEALWGAVRTLKDRAALLRRLSRDAERRRASASAKAFAARAEHAARHAEILRRLVVDSAADEPSDPTVAT